MVSSLREKLPSHPPDIVTSSGRKLRTTAAFRSYWHVAAERQAMLYRRLRGDRILTEDQILRTYRFTNAYRAADRVSQYLISEVIPGSDEDVEDVVFRVLLFKIFNRIETWRSLERGLQEPIRWANFSVSRYNHVLSGLIDSGESVYSNAYIMPNPSFGERFKHANHLMLLGSEMKKGLARHVFESRNLRGLYNLLKGIPSFGPFLAFQYAIDLNYSKLCCFDEMEFVVPGPGAIDGIRKCFEDVAGYSDADVIKIMTEIAAREFEDFELEFQALWGRPLQLIDCQNLFCEVGKYARIAHPELGGLSGRVRIKQRYAPSREPMPKYVFPQHWGLDTSGLCHISKIPS